MDLKTCHTCIQSYMGADVTLRCRVNGLPVKPELWEDCKRYIREPGSDDHLEVKYCDGRGD